jgi:hypothetical protein
MVYAMYATKDLTHTCFLSFESFDTPSIVTLKYFWVFQKIPIPILEV